MNIIEPCCAERQLGQLLREAHGQAALFQTNGDVTAKLFIKNTMLLSGDRPRTLTIAASEMPQEAMRLISHYASLGYIATLRLMVHESDLALHPAFPDCNIELALLPDDKPVPELMMWRGSSHTVVIQGTMPDVKTPALHLYGGQLNGNNSPAIRAATAAFEALFRARRAEVNHGDWNNDSSEAKIEVPVPGDSQQTETAAPSEAEPEKPSFDEAQGTPVLSVAVPQPLGQRTLATEETQEQKQPKKTIRKKTTTDEHPKKMA